MNGGVMNIEMLLAQPIFQSVGWALVHFIWQGAFVAALLAATRTLIATSSANARYVAACSALLLMLILPVVTTYSVHSSLATSTKEQAAANAVASGVHQSAATADERGVRSAAPDDAIAREEVSPSVVGRWAEERFSPLLPALVLVWLIGVAILWLRFFCGWLVTQRLRRGACPADEQWLASLRRVSQRMRVSRPVRLCQSALVEVPTVVGWLSPIVLVPASALTGLGPRQLEAVLAHELAHIKRHDYLVNLLQSFVETLLFYHPAVWWVSGQVRREREFACDDAAIAACCGGDALPYARALAELEHLRGGVTRLVVAANGGSLLQRIKRLVQTPAPASRPSSAMAVVVAVLTLCSLLAGARAATFTNLSETFPKATELPKVNSVEAAENLTTAAPSHETAAAPRGEDDALRDEAAANIARDEVTGEDTEVRQAAVAALAGRAGAVVVMDTQTGRVYTVVNQEWALRRGWSPASTIKLVTAAAGLNEKVVSAKEAVAVSSGAQKMNLIRALAVSNSDYFVTVGTRLGSDHFIDYARRLGLGELTGINYPRESAGRVPARGGKTGVGRMSAYGEGIEVTPAQLATLVSAIANGGDLLVPQVPRAGQDAAATSPRVRRRLDLSRDVLASLADGMTDAVREGSAQPAAVPAFTVAGKTGTANTPGSSLGLFASYAPAERPRFAVVVAMRGAGERGPTAADVAGKIYRALTHRL